ncbi:MAG: serine/threonine protein kinase [Archangium sp.]|nr:serine/threonine protein kinase [Archangium sp.]
MTRLAGKYELVRPLGQGGMAEVFEAVLHGDAGFRRRVAVKRMAADRVGDERLQRMFVDEARLASRLFHPNLVAVIDFGIAEGVAFQVLELVDGFDVARLASWGVATNQPMPTVVALGIAAHVAHALHAAHTATGDDGAPLNIVHRDVSPQNVLVSRGGDVKLADFGIALWEQRTEKTLGATARGKPTYMAPEQAMRSAIDARADVFSLGCTLHALLTGHSPLQDENALVDLLSGVELEPAPTLSPPLRELLGRAIRRDRQERFPSAEAFAQACERVLKSLAPADFDVRRALREWTKAVVPPDLAMPATPMPSTAAPPVRRRWAWPAAVVTVSLSAGAFMVATRAPTAAPVAAAPAEPTVAPTPAPPVAPAPAPAPVSAAEPPKPKRPAVVVASPETRGVLAIGGERFLKGEVLVDGRSVGFAPRQLELSSGTHQVEIVLVDGTRVGPRALTIGPQHTESSPQRWVE